MLNYKMLLKQLQIQNGSRIKKVMYKQHNRINKVLLVHKQQNKQKLLYPSQLIQFI